MFEYPWKYPKLNVSLPSLRCIILFIIVFSRLSRNCGGWLDVKLP
jgi:hypothetical protein